MRFLNVVSDTLLPILAPRSTAYDNGMDVFGGFMTAIHVIQRLPPHKRKGHLEGGLCGGSV
jgi:hypothetical protein